MSSASAFHLSLMLPVNEVQDDAQQAQRKDMSGLRTLRFIETAACVPT